MDWGTNVRACRRRRKPLILAQGLGVQNARGSAGKTSGGSAKHGGRCAAWAHDVGYDSFGTCRSPAWALCMELVWRGVEAYALRRSHVSLLNSNMCGSASDRKQSGTARRREHTWVAPAQHLCRGHWRGGAVHAAHWPAGPLMR